MLFNRLKQIIFLKKLQSIYFRPNPVTKRNTSHRYVWLNILFSAAKTETLAVMSHSSKLRIYLRDLNITRLWSVWTRSYNISSIVRRYRRDRGVREIIQCFKKTILKPKRTLLFATAAYNSQRNDDEDTKPNDQEEIITDEELEALLSELERVDELSRLTLYCTCCGKRLVIDKPHAGIPYCVCKHSKVLESNHDGWVPYMEADDVVIWRKEYKPGQGLFAYKVYGRYPEVRAEDFAAVQLDGEYRTSWDAAVAALGVVESTNGVDGQAVLHWEVMWPRLFANRDYVYLRRHKEFTVKNKDYKHKDGLFHPLKTEPLPVYEERPSVHSRARQKSMESYAKERDGVRDNKVYVILSRSCVHPKVPETKHAIRVMEYWSHMVVKTLNGDGQPGMEYVLTYYDEPGSGGMPNSVAAWATGRAAPAYLGRMRQAALEYRSMHQDGPDFSSFTADKQKDDDKGKSQENVSEEHIENEGEQNQVITVAEDVINKCGDTKNNQTTNQGPELESSEIKRDQSTQTEMAPQDGSSEKSDMSDGRRKENDESGSEKSEDREEEQPKCEQDEENNNNSWWRYLYPFYYFV